MMDSNDAIIESFKKVIAQMEGLPYAARVRLVNVALKPEVVAITDPDFAGDKPELGMKILGVSCGYYKAEWVARDEGNLDSRPAQKREFGESISAER